jgi:Scavenger receptor cysteine-rich domain/Low-density lipoprotein receptor domain class A
LCLFFAETWKCNFDEIACNVYGDGPCFPSMSECDGLPNCPGPNPKDESKCADNCKNDEFYCSFQKTCIPAAWRCDAVNDCTSGEDESHCDCPEESFRCHSGGCVAASHVCDGARQCPDFSDEWNCFSTNSTASAMNDLLTIKNLDGDELKVCNDHWNMYFSKLFCLKLGYNDAKSWTSVNISVIEADQEMYFRLKSGAQIVSLAKDNFEVTPMCENGMVVSIQCADNTKTGEVGSNKSVGRIVSDLGRNCTATIGL